MFEVPCVISLLCICPLTVIFSFVPCSLLQAFSIDIIRHKDSVDELLSQRGEIFGTCGEEQKAMLQVNP